MVNQRKIRYFLHEVYLQGGVQFDTAPLYSSLDAERILGKIFPEADFPDILISTKMGYKYSNSIFPLNRFYSRIGRIGNDGLPVKLLQNSAEQELKSSLIRLRRKKIQTFFLHDIDDDLQIKILMGELIELKEKGFIREIGLATRAKHIHIPKEVDCLQIPIHLVDHYSERVECKLQVHSLFANGQRTAVEAQEKIEKLKNIPHVSALILGTTNILHFKQIWEMVNPNG